MRRSTWFKFRYSVMHVQSTTFEESDSNCDLSLYSVLATQHCGNQTPSVFGGQVTKLGSECLRAAGAFL